MGVESIREQPELLVARLLGYKGKGSWQRQSHASTGILWFHHRFLVYLRPVQLITHQWISGARVSRLCQSQRDVCGERDGFEFCGRSTRDIRSNHEMYCANHRVVREKLSR